VSYDETLAAFRRGDNVEAARLAQQDVTRAQESDDSRAHVDGLCMLARIALRDGDLDAVAARAHDAEVLARSASDKHLLRMPLHLRAAAARMKGQYDEGRELYLTSIAINEELGEPGMAAAEYRNLAYLEIRAGNVARARELFAESAARFAGLDTPAMAAYLTFDAATLAALDGDYETAAARLRAADAQWAEQRAVPDPDDAAEITALRRELRRAGVIPGP
jgi:ATP/maltotriose-dependent transcriptional regulator MalT